MNPAPSHAPADPLTTLREYRALAPWGLRDLAALAGGILDASGVVPVNAAARARPSERTIRFYVARGLVSPPDGRGTAAVYSYRHLLQVLAIKLRQMEGATLESMLKEFTGLTGDLIERRAASALGPGLPPPEQLPLLRTPGTGRGRIGRAVMAWLAPVEGLTSTSSTCRRIAVAPGVEVLIDEQHPALRLNGDAMVIAEALRQALASVVGLDTSPLFAEDRRAVVEPGWKPVEHEAEALEQSRVGSDTSS
jgi:MerR-like DNA binding protein